jgi:UDP-N-acetylmuramoyl-tripeptide--D-alanyl-D-alanine ligase
MRLNLGEIASFLGCRPARILWENGVAGDLSGASGEERTPGDSSTIGGSDARRHEETGGYSSGFPWESYTPTGAQADSRLVKPGNLFFCLPGERTDGHLFALEATQAGASAIIALRDPFEGREMEAREAQLVLPPVFLVDDVQHSLWRVAVCHRDTSIARVVGVTGSAGKTSVKEALAQVLAIRGVCERNPKNLNNQIGLPLSMLNAEAEASFWVMEMGISKSGDMAELASILRPDVALILNVGEAHLEGLGDKGVAAHKAQLLDYLQPGGVAVVSEDYADLNAEVAKRREALERRAVRLTRFSMLSEDCNCHARYLGPGYELNGRYEVVLNDAKVVVDAPFRGDFGSENVAAVCAVANFLGLTWEEIIRGLACAVIPEQRFHGQVFGDFVLIDDSYNANPLSMERMLAAARTMADERGLPLILVLGEMRELGERADAAHEKLGQEAAEAHPLCVFWKGEYSSAVRRGLRENGYGGDFYPVGGGQEFSHLLEELKPTHGVVLFKGSRGNQLERLAEVFRDMLMAGGDHAV